MKASVQSIDTVSTSNSFVLVDSFGKELSADGEEKTVLYGPKDSEGVKTSYIISDDEITDNVGGILKNLYKGRKLVGLPKGSVVQYVNDANGEIAAIRIMYIPGSTDNYFETGRYEVTKDYMSAIYQCYAKVVTYLPESNRLVWNGHEQGEDRTWDRSSGMGGNVYLHDSKTDRITTIDKTQILPGDDIFLSQSNYSTKMTVVYR